MATYSLKDAVGAIRKTHGTAIKIVAFKDGLGDDLFHFQVKDESNGVTGFGSAITSETSLAKAYSEYVERRVVRDLVSAGAVRSSNGFAAHLSEVDARNAAVDELIERDLFMATWLARLSPIWLGDDVLATMLTPTAASQVKLIEDSGSTIRFGVLGQCQQTVGMVGVLDGGNSKFGSFGRSVATAASKFPATAVESVIFALRRAISEVKSRVENGLTAFEQLDESGVKAPIDHRTYFLNPEKAHLLDWYIKSSATAVPDLPPLHVVTETRDLNFSTAWSIYVARAQSAECQQYFCGFTSDEFINFERLRSLGISPSLVNREIHPLP